MIPIISECRMDVGQGYVRIARDDLVGRAALAFMENVNVPHTDAGTRDARFGRGRIDMDVLMCHEILLFNHSTSDKFYKTKLLKVNGPTSGNLDNTLKQNSTRTSSMANSL
jgi:hypothetical protein